jgi:hypothetical protein
MNWKILNLNYKKNDGFVFTVYASLEKEGVFEDRTIIARKMFVFDFDQKTDSFIDLKDLKPETIIGWITPLIDEKKEIDFLQKIYDKQMELLTNQNVSGLPWESNE